MLGKEDSHHFAFVSSACHLGVLMGDGAAYGRLALQKMQERLQAVRALGVDAAQVLCRAMPRARR
eukprot:6487473-Amphidinium_carterae.3